MDVKQRNDELEALRQQVAALTASREKLRRYTQELEKLYPGDTTIIREWLEVTHDDLLDPAPPLPVLDPMACAERDTTPLVWVEGGEGK